MTEVTFTDKQVASMLAEKSHLIFLLLECQLALEHFPDESYGSNHIFKSKQLLQKVKEATTKYK
ncbi:MAG: hypothetical protein WCP46_00205 [Alphaproteobacteria bacterium]